MWPSLALRPDFCFTTGYLGYYNLCLKVLYSTIQKRIMRYIKGLLNMGILYNALFNKGLIRYSDTNYRGDLQDRKLISSMVFTLFSSSISQASIKQKTVTIATIIAKYITLIPVIKEALQLK